MSHAAERIAVPYDMDEWQCNVCIASQAARDIASTIAASQNRVFLNSDSLLLNLVSVIGVNADRQHVSSIVFIVLIEQRAIICAWLSAGSWTSLLTSSVCAGGDGCFRWNEEVGSVQQHQT